MNIQLTESQAARMVVLILRGEAISATDYEILGELYEAMIDKNSHNTIQIAEFVRLRYELMTGESIPWH